MSVHLNSSRRPQVGELGVASFGETVKLLHAFDQPWSDDAGAAVVSRFSFSQRRTDTATTLRSIVSLLDTAKQNVRASSAGVSTQCLQLVFLISDGRFDRDRRDTVRRWVREAAQRNQLLVLLVCDGPDPANSILETKSVRCVFVVPAVPLRLLRASHARRHRYVKGKMSIVRYLDDYPFPYYIILRDTGGLPDALADALRQWFEMISARG